ncbi:MAG: NTP transferase domain-containing protein [Bacteroidales bacterium]|jgi:NDP-sugar pyrophosphorylase family protein|nr:NTP transferase domain-containing protein [Bacteroidales bacterium]
MEALLLSAGLGTRLKPLTNNKPKALVEISGKTLLEINIQKLISYGIFRIVVNVHHFAEQIIEYIKNHNFDADIFISNEQYQLLDTGGGLLNAKPFFSLSENIIVHNVDIISNIDFKILENIHTKSSNAIATLAISKRNTSRQLLFNKELELKGWQNKNNGKKIIIENDTETLTPFGFSGIQILSPEIFNLFTKKECFPIIPQYLEICRNHTIKGFVHNHEKWIDAGKISDLPLAEKLLMI